MREAGGGGQVPIWRDGQGLVRASSEVCTVLWDNSSQNDIYILPSHS